MLSKPESQDGLRRVHLKIGTRIRMWPRILIVFGFILVRPVLHPSIQSNLKPINSGLFRRVIFGATHGRNPECKCHYQ
jgi:hypothetical protein